MSWTISSLVSHGLSKTIANRHSNAFHVGAKELFVVFVFRNSSKKEDREKQLEHKLTKAIIFIGQL